MQREERQRPSRLDPLPKIRSLSCDEALARRPRLPGDDDAEAEGLGAQAPAAARGDRGHNILVAVRCRPLHAQEINSGAKSIIKVLGNGKTVVLEDPQTTAADDYLRINKSKERSYAFDAAFHEATGTRQVYEMTTRSLIGGVLEGFNATVFAYGATGAGKTHTMLGNPSSPGIMMLTLLDLFGDAQLQKENRLFEVKCSFLEVYNENIRDLLRPDADYLDIREDPVNGMCVAGISEVGGLESAKEIMALLQQANRHRTTEATCANVTSSRSHAVLQVVVEQRDRTSDIVAQVNVGKLSMIDLAGSERASHTQNKGIRMIEGANINRSLLALGNCITALSSSVSFVPYRDSKMTRLLKDSLGGNCRTVMIANLSPHHLHYEDTHNTLKYANRAKNIKTKTVRNVVRVSSHVSKYNDIIKDLKGEIADLQAKLTTPNDVAKCVRYDPSMFAGGGPGAGREAVHVQSAKWKQELMQNFEERVRLKRRLIDLAHVAQTHMVKKSHAQVGISQWESAQFGGGSPTSQMPQPIQGLHSLLRNIKTEMAHTEETTQGLEDMLVENQRKFEKLQAELPTRVQNKDMRAFLGLVSRIHVLEVENMDTQEMNAVTTPLIHQKELEAEALRLQIQLRDRVIADQNRMLAEDRDLAPFQKPEGWVDVVPKGLPLSGELQALLEDDGELAALGAGDRAESRVGDAAGGSAGCLRDQRGSRESPPSLCSSPGVDSASAASATQPLAPLAPLRSRAPSRAEGQTQATPGGGDGDGQPAAGSPEPPRAPSPRPPRSPAEPEGRGLAVQGLHEAPPRAAPPLDASCPEPAAAAAAKAPLQLAPSLQDPLQLDVSGHGLGQPLASAAPPSPARRDPEGCSARGAAGSPRGVPRSLDETRLPVALGVEGQPALPDSRRRSEDGPPSGRPRAEDGAVAAAKDAGAEPFSAGQRTRPPNLSAGRRAGADRSRATRAAEAHNAAAERRAALRELDRRRHATGLQVEAVGLLQEGDESAGSAEAVRPVAGVAGSGGGSDSSQQPSARGSAQPTGAPGGRASRETSVDRSRAALERLNGRGPPRSVG